VIAPKDAVQVTAVFVVVPCTNAVKETAPPAATLAEVGETLTESTTAGGVGVEDGDVEVALS
jgi:hypothetical protein